MRRALNLLGFVVIGLAIASALQHAVDWLDPPETEWRMERANIKEVSADGAWEGMQLLVVGNSHARTIKLSEIDKSGRPIVRAGGDVREAQMTIRHWIPRATDVDTVMYAASYYSFQADNGLSDDGRSNRIMYYAINPATPPQMNDWKNYALGNIQKAFPHVQIVRWDAWETPLRAIPVRVGDAFRHVDGEDPAYVEHSEACSDMPPSLPEEVAVHRAVDEAFRSREQGSDVVDALSQTLVETAEFLGARNVRFVAVTPPFHWKYTDAYRREFPGGIEAFRERMRGIASTTGMEYFDYSEDERWSLHDQMFSDGDHLNPCGGRSFSRALAVRVFDS